MLLDLPKFLWAESIATSVYLYNRTPHRTNGYQTPIELLNGSDVPKVSHLHPFGCKSFVHIPPETRPAGSKLQPREIEGLFMGYTGSSKIFRIFIPQKRVVIITRQVVFPDTKSGEETFKFTQPTSNQRNTTSHSSPMLVKSTSSDSDRVLTQVPSSPV